MADIDVVLIPSGGAELLIFPQTLVSRVFPYAPPLSSETETQFVVGSMLVNNEKMPVVDFIFTPRMEPYEGNQRIVLVSTISSDVGFLRYSIVSYGEPITQTINESGLVTKQIGGHRFIAQYANIIGYEQTPAVILDLPKFESELKMK